MTRAVLLLLGLTVGCCSALQTSYFATRAASASARATTVSSDHRFARDGRRRRRTCVRRASTWNPAEHEYDSDVWRDFGDYKRRGADSAADETGEEEEDDEEEDHRQRDEAAAWLTSVWGAAEESDEEEDRPTPRTVLADVPFARCKPTPFRSFVSIWLAERSANKWRLEAREERGGVVVSSLDGGGAVAGSLRLALLERGAGEAAAAEGVASLATREMAAAVLRIESSGGGFPFLLQEAVLVGALLDELIGIWDHVQGAGESASAPSEEEGAGAAEATTAIIAAATTTPKKVVADEDRIFAFGESELEDLAELRTRFASSF